MARDPRLTVLREPTNVPEVVQPIAPEAERLFRLGECLLHAHKPMADVDRRPVRAGALQKTALF